MDCLLSLVITRVLQKGMSGEKASPSVEGRCRFLTSSGVSAAGGFCQAMLARQPGRLRNGRWLSFVSSSRMAWLSSERLKNFRCRSAAGRTEIQKGKFKIANRESNTENRKAKIAKPRLVARRQRDAGRGFRTRNSESKIENPKSEFEIGKWESETRKQQIQNWQSSICNLQSPQPPTPVPRPRPTL